MPRRGVDLTEEQWARVKAQAATRRQTISQFLGNVVDEILPDGSVRPAMTDVKLIEVSLVEDTPENRAAGSHPITSMPGKAASASYSTRPFTPAPKPGAKK